MFKKTYILLILLVSISTWLLGSGVSAATTPKQAYHGAEACYKKLRDSSSKMKYRDNWLRCIKKFKQVYRLNHGGSWAPAGLYMSGKLYQELANYSGKKSDLQEARDIYERIIKRYPSSRYQNKAALALRKLSATKTASKKPASTKPAQPSKQSATDIYRAAESCYGNMKQDSRKMKLRDNWLQCIEKFYASYRKDPTGPKGAAGLFMTGKLYADLHGYSNRKSDLRAAHTMYERIIDKFPDSRYRVKAELLID